MENKCTILWTNADPITAKSMVFMYAENALKFKWWEEVTIVVWGATTKLVAENKELQDKLLDLKSKGVHISFCKKCADDLGVTPLIEELNFELIYWGVPLTELLKSDSKLLTI